jgi:shikimate 5-dehydrogenase
MRFVGVNTATSSIMTIFPDWSRLLGLGAELVGLDIPLGAGPGAYRDALTSMREDPACAGALVTTHKISMFEAARDLFDDVDEFAAEVGEVSSIAFRHGRTLGAAKDPITAGLALEEVLAHDHFGQGGGHVLCLGAGGAGIAIGWYLARRPDAPASMTFLDTAPNRLAHLREVVDPHAAWTDLHTVATADTDVAALVETLPRGSLVINATGLGKDRPGTPLPDGVALPRQGVIWELNYRGTLEFLGQARAQAEEQDLTVVDGWRYFIHGWTQVIAEVFKVPMGPEVVQSLSQAAQDTR